MKLKTFHGVLFGAVFLFPASIAAQTTSYEANLNDRADDKIRVTVHLEGLESADSIFQFASTAPGTYQVMDIGRFVSDFVAVDESGTVIPSEHVSVNQWRFSNPSRVSEVRYKIAETWDTPVEENQIYLMCGTSLEADHVLVNPHAVFGFPARRQDEPVRVHFDYPEGWRVGTALVPDMDGWYPANDYDHLIDSPFLFGGEHLTVATTTVGDVPVEVWVYSATGVVQAPALLSTMGAMLSSAGQFLNGLPVDRYAFLWHFSEQSSGAWEHSYSSEYVQREPPQWNDELGQNYTSIAAHEFFHVVTPLNIHSEIIEHFNFEKPTPSRHIWLYEGITEWAAQSMQVRSGLVDLPTYLNRIAGKIRSDRRAFDPDLSLLGLSMTSYSPEGQRQWGNIYQRGAVVGNLLDIRLLELSGGQRGLRELIIELANEYGPSRPFPDDEFFDIVVQKTYPEIREILDNHIRDTKPMPIAEYFAKLGIRFVDGDRPRFEIMDDATPEQLRLREAWMRGRPMA